MFRHIVALCLWLVVAVAQALSVHERVENFVLLDHIGNAHELYYHRSAKAVVIMAQANNCAAVQDALHDYKMLRDKFEPLGVKFFMLNSTLADQRPSIAAEAQRYGIDIPILDDESQLIGESLALRHAGEVLVLNPKNWQLAYRGPLSVAAQPFAADAINAIMQGAEVVVEQRPSTGCPIDYAQQASISYSKTIAPMLQEKCVVCHTEGGLGPWAMSSYTMVQGFAPMIREVLRTKRMPPWHADPHVGVWKNDISLSVEQRQLLVHWIEAGAPRGDGADPLATTQTVSLQWPLGEPDLVLDIPAYTVPASGVVDYQFPTVKNPLVQGVWIKAATVVPGDRQVVHHILAGTQDVDTTDLRRDSGVFDNYLIGYAPGNESHIFPDDTGVYIPPGGEFLFQMHYTPVGRETTDRSKIGLYFHQQTPRNFFRQDVIVDPTIKIPANTSHHKEMAYYAFDKPILLHDLMPHAHYRGVASRFELWKPDGSTELLLNVPNYDFNWQRTYEFVVPRKIEAGSRLIHTTWYDNSTDNAANPDAEREVPWGLQSWDEMLFGAFGYTYIDESTEAPIHDKLRARTTQYVGFLDKNIDGKLSWKELPRPLKKRLVQGFKAVDSNGDGGLDIDEMYAISKRRSEAQAKKEVEQGAEAR